MSGGRGGRAGGSGEHLEDEERYQSLLDIAPDAIVVSTDARMVYVNHAAVQLFAARDVPDLIGRSIFEVVHPDFHGELQGRLDSASAPGERSVRFEHQLVALDGRIIHAESVAIMLTFRGRLSRQTILRDVTERRRSDEALRASESRYREVASLTTDLVYESEHYPDGSARLLWVTDGPFGNASPPVGVRLPEEKWTAYMNAEYAAARVERLERLWRGETDTREVRLALAGGQVRWLHTVERPRARAEDGRWLRVIGTAKDVTALHEAADKQRALEEELRKTRELHERALLNHLQIGSEISRVVRPSGERSDGEGRRSAGARAAFFGAGAGMRKVQELGELAAGHGEAVLITGDTGTGKGYLAQWIHDHSAVAGQPFVALNCSSLRGEMLMSELFGHARGAFTSAVRERRGLVEEADGGTLFLDEIGDMEGAAQAQLLKVLEEKVFRRVGESGVRRSNFRLMCATHHDLRRAVDAGTFRKDLYFRVNVFPIELPSLHARSQDLPALIDHLLADLGAANAVVPAATRDFLARYPWPGNLRELRNALIRALLLARTEPLEARHFPGLDPSLAAAGRPLALPEEPAPLDEKALKSQIAEALQRFRGNRSRAARALNMSRTTLYRYMEKLGLE